MISVGAVRGHYVFFSTHFPVAAGNILARCPIIPRRVPDSCAARMGDGLCSDQACPAFGIRWAMYPSLIPRTGGKGRGTRWAVETIVRFLEQMQGGRRPISHATIGIAIQVYLGIIACPSIAWWTPRKPTLRTYVMICHDVSGLADEEEPLAHITRRFRYLGRPAHVAQAGGSCCAGQDHAGDSTTASAIPRPCQRFQDHAPLPRNHLHHTDAPQASPACRQGHFVCRAGLGCPTPHIQRRGIGT